MIKRLLYVLYSILHIIATVISMICIVISWPVVYIVSGYSTFDLVSRVEDYGPDNIKYFKDI